MCGIPMCHTTQLDNYIIKKLHYIVVTVRKGTCKLDIFLDSLTFLFNKQDVRKYVIITIVV